ncbi:MAG: tRNA (adenosine(37)-N6)-threonylcarbamoyltransferase complex ATPase subunit type 1 TsaE [Flavobacteriaceae bacterium]|jgi:tRNA threonylcarbamoyladenosine biosynthesis protein TsaE|nr:tRNA (adenosine(37)-N6)-threonylcarbamoyltransferase complex ATPase subunit type 1 TsaE [Flavobacteriaceae bacterium]
MEIVFTLQEIDQVAKTIIEQVKHKIVLFDAPMGAGKTTLIKALAKQLDINDLTSSPTFSIVNEYKSESTNTTVYHFDLYRMEEEEEAYDMGMDEYLNSNAWCFIEWPEKAENMLSQEETSKITLEILPDGQRKLQLHNS